MLATDSATELAAAIRRREVGSVELLDLYLDRIDHLGGDVNAVVTLDVDRARAACAAADAALARGDDVGPLHGLPITVKDAIETAGIRSTGGAVELTDHVPADDAPVVARVKAAGAVVFGKTNLPALVRRPAELQRALRHHQQPVGHRRGCRAAAPAARRPRWPAGSRRSRSAPTSAARSGSRRTSAARSGSSPASASSRSAATSTASVAARPTPTSTCSDRWPAAPRTSTCSSTSWPVPTPTAPSPGGSSCRRRRSTRSSGARVAVWFDEAAYPIDAEYRAVLDRAADALADAGAQVEAAHPPVDMAEQVASVHRR